MSDDKPVDGCPRCGGDCAPDAHNAPTPAIPYPSRDGKVAQLRSVPSPDADTVTIEVTPMIAALLKVVTLGVREQHKAISEQLKMLPPGTPVHLASPAPTDAEIMSNAFRIGLERIAGRVLGSSAHGPHAHGPHVGAYGVPPSLLDPT